jgi:hypothetical protein
MKHLATLVLMLLFGTCSQAQARLGETPNQVAARFGKGVPLYLIPHIGPWVGLHLQEFKKQGFEIQVLFTHISVGETYRACSELTESQIQALLAANSQGHSWKEDGSSGVIRTWIRDDGAKARLAELQFEFKSKFLVDKEEAWSKAQLPSVDGF